MDGPHRKVLSACRRRLQNPYAYLEDLEPEAVAEVAVSHEASLQQEIHDSRRLLQDPYAYLDEDGYAATPANATVGAEEAIAAQVLPKQPGTAKVVQAFTLDGGPVERAVRDTHRLVWTNRNRDSGPVLSDDELTELLDPAAALKLLGFEVEFPEGLGQFRKGNQLIEVAGLIDTGRRAVAVSSQFPSSVRRFTMAHELAHAVLHPGLSGVHRDKPVDCVGSTRNQVEWEADRFASLYLMPERLIRRHFKFRFGQAPFSLSEDTLFALGGDEARALKHGPGVRAISLALAGVSRFNGRHFTSMAVQFGVSRTAMAIRLEELDLINPTE